MNQRGVTVEALAELLWRQDRALAPVRLLGEAPAAPSRAATRSGGVVHLVQRRGGEMLRMEFGATPVEVKATGAARLLRELLLHPNTDFDYPDLVARFLAAPGDAVDAPSADEDLEPEGALGRTMSPEDVARIRQQVGKLKEQLAKAKRPARDRIAGEIERTEAFLAKDLDHRGRPRQMSDPGEKASKRVRAGLDRLIGKIDEKHRSLATHLKASIERRNGVRYAPKPHVEWSE